MSWPTSDECTTVQSGPSNQETKADPATGVFWVYSFQGNSFLDGAVNIGQTSSNRFIKCKLLINTGEIVPSGIAILEDFFVVI